MRYYTLEDLPAALQSLPPEITRVICLGLMDELGNGISPLATWQSCINPEGMDKLDPVTLNLVIDSVDIAISSVKNVLNVVTEEVNKLPSTPVSFVERLIRLARVFLYHTERITWFLWKWIRWV